MPDRQIGIIATEFGGAGDPQESAYGGVVNPQFFEVSLPARVPEHLRRVRVFYDGKSLVAVVNDVGPHNTHDDYWNHPGTRPLAELQHGNHAGIDMTPAVHDALGVPGKRNERTAKIDWEFALDDHVWPKPGEIVS